MIITDIGTYPGHRQEDDIILNSRMKIESCSMCMDCWYKTPGICMKKDGLARMSDAVKSIDEMIIVSRCFCGSVSSFVKKILDRCTPVLKPGWETSGGKVRHSSAVKRYDVSVFFYGESISPDEKKTAEEMVKDMVFQLHGEVKKVVFVEDPWAIGGMEA